jgi:4-aminobutyrate aminotransferase-like enzyme
MEHAYHGNSWAIAQISDSYENGETKQGNIVMVPCPDTYRGVHRGDDAARHYAGYIAEAVDTLRQRGHQPCAFIVDTIFSSNGLPDLPSGYLQRAVEIFREAGGVFVADEVQPGFGRTDTHFWGYENHGVRPDIVTMGKSMGNGHPISAVVTSAEIIDQFEEKARYFNTFGGNPVSSAAAKSVLEVIDQENLQANALEVGSYIREQLAGLAQHHELIGDIRGAGLFNGVDLVRSRDTREPASEEAKKAVNAMRELGVLIGSTGPDDNVLKMRSPMVFSKENADILLDCLDQTLGKITSA